MPTKKTTRQQRSMRMQQIIFITIAVIVILSMIISIVAK